MIAIPSFPSRPVSRLICAPSFVAAEGAPVSFEGDRFGDTCERDMGRDQADGQSRALERHRHLLRRETRAGGEVLGMAGECGAQA